MPELVWKSRYPIVANEYRVEGHPIVVTITLKSVHADEVIELVLRGPRSPEVLHHLLDTSEIKIHVRSAEERGQVEVGRHLVQFFGESELIAESLFTDFEILPTA